MEPFARLGLILLLLWSLTACQKAGVKPMDDPLLFGQGDVSRAYIEDLLGQARQAEPAERVQLHLTALEALIAATEYDWARNLVEEFPTEILSRMPAFASERGRFALVNAKLKNEAGETGLALAYLDGEQILENLSYYPAELGVRIREQRATLLFDLGDFVGSVDERVRLTQALADEEEAALINQENLWQTLMTMPLEQLRKQLKTQQSRAHQGWYELAVISKNNQTNMRAQLQEVEQWQRRWPEHPASLSLPADLQLLNELVASQPQRVAVLLPGSGRLKVAADAIRSGLLAAFYELQADEITPPEIRFYDTEGGDIDAVYQSAVEAGAELIIGPLDKEKIISLSNRLNLPVPTLALNTVDNPLGYIGNLYQFGLGVEDEARLAAQRVWRDGHRRVLMLAPATSWGDRCVSTFAQQWQNLGGEHLQDYRFEDKNDYAKVIKHALHVDASEERAKRIRALVGSIEFEPRRRLDVDALFVAASAAQARQIKPTLAFYFASELPVYATSNVFEGTANTKLDQDMNGMMFSTLPWFFSDDLEEKNAIMQSPSGNTRLQSLYALGVDSFHLYPRLKQLQMVKGARFYGQTGSLALAPSGQIVRDQVWAQFVRGRARKLNDTDQ